MTDMNNLALTRRQVLGLGALLGVSACMPRVLREAGGEGDAFDWTLESPDSAGLAPSVGAALRASIQQYIDGKQIAGAVTAIARNNQLVWFEAQGASDPVTGVPMRKDDLFRMMSSTKVVTAVAVLTLLDEGKLSIDDKVSRFIPEMATLMVAERPTGAKDSQAKRVPAHRAITVKDLLTHTSGLASGGAPSPELLALLSKNMLYPAGETLATHMAKVARKTLDFQPGTRFAYSGLDGFDVLARVCEVVSGQPADVFMRERIFEPLEMRNTWFHVPAGEQARIVPLYVRAGDAWNRAPALLDGVPATYTSGAGGLKSTAHDFMNFELMLLNKGSLNGRRVLKSETVALMAQNHVGSLFAEWEPSLTAGLGFGLGVRVVLDGQKVPYRGVGSFGWGGAYGTETWADPQFGIAGVIMVQQSVRELAPTFQAALRRSIIA
jgi:CubicO group peptidase (beta-lactamase class C family)